MNLRAETILASGAAGKPLALNKDWQARLRTAFEIVTSRPLAAALILNVVLFGLFLTLATPYYETNDDLSMQYIASGSYTGKPCEFLVFTNVLIGLPLRLLYTLWNGPNWYCYYLIAVHFASLTAFLGVIFSRRRDLISVFLYLGFFLFVELRILLKLQFTTTAFLAGFAGVLLLGDAFHARGKCCWSKAIIGFGFVSLACMIREQVAPMLALVAVPFLCERLGHTGWRRGLAAGIVGVSLFLSLHQFNAWYYGRKSDWAEFREYNLLRGDIHGSLLGRLIERESPSIGWSTNDTKMFLDGAYSDPEVFGSLSKMRDLHDRLQIAARAEPLIWNFSPLYLFLPRLFGGDAGLLMYLSLLNVALLLYFSKTRRFRYTVTLLATYLFFALFSFYVRETARLPQRVSYNMPLLLNAICLYWVTCCSSKLFSFDLKGFKEIIQTIRQTGVTRLPVAAFVPIVVVSYLYLTSEIVQNMSWVDFNHRNLKRSCQHAFQFMRTAAFGIQKPTIVQLPFASAVEESLFFCHDEHGLRYFLVPYGWVSHSPVFKAVLAQSNLRPYSRSLIDRSDIFFLMNSDWIHPLRIFYREHFGIETQFDLVVSTDDNPAYRNTYIHLYQAHSVHSGPTEHSMLLNPEGEKRNPQISQTDVLKVDSD